MTNIEVYSGIIGQEVWIVTSLVFAASAVLFGLMSVRKDRRGRILCEDSVPVGVQFVIILQTVVVWILIVLGNDITVVDEFGQKSVSIGLWTLAVAAAFGGLQFVILEVTKCLRRNNLIEKKKRAISRKRNRRQ